MAAERLVARLTRQAMRHFSFVPTKTKAGRVVEHVTEWQTRGAADKASLRLLGQHGAGAAASIAGDLAEGDPVPADTWGRKSG